MRRVVPLILVIFLGCEVETQKGATGSPAADGEAGEPGEEGTPGEAGEAGDDGAAGQSCWDLNGDGVEDAEEDVNGDGSVDVSDCQGEGWRARVVDPRDYGAIADDGLDDTEALQAAIEAAEDGLGIVEIPGGTWQHTGLVVSRGIWIRGVGWDTVLNNSGDSHSIARTGGADTATMGLTISDLSLEHDGAGSDVDGIHLEHLANHLRIDRVKVDGATGHCVYLQGGVKSETGTLYPVILQAFFDGCGGHGLYVQGGVNAGVLTG